MLHDDIVQPRYRQVSWNRRRHDYQLAVSLERRLKRAQYHPPRTARNPKVPTPLNNHRNRPSRYFQAPPNGPTHFGVPTQYANHLSSNDMWLPCGQLCGVEYYSGGCGQYWPWRTASGMWEVYCSTKIEVQENNSDQTDFYLGYLGSLESSHPLGQHGNRPLGSIILWQQLLLLPLAPKNHFRSPRHRSLTLNHEKYFLSLIK